MARPLRPEECHRKPEAGQRPGSSSGDPRMMAAVSQSTADGMHGSERTLGSQPVESLSHRLERIELLNDHRDELLLQCAQSRRLLESFLCRTWLVEGDVASFQPFAAARAQGKAYNEAARGQKKHQMGQPFMSVFATFVNGLTTEALGPTGLEGVGVAWLHEFRKKLTSALDVVSSRCGTFARPTRKGRPVRTLIRYRMCAPDPALQEDAQSITKLAHILRKVLVHRKGTEQEGPAPPTNNERKIQSQLEQPQKSGGQIRLGHEMDIYETDLAESLAMWCFGEEDEVFQ